MKLIRLLLFIFLTLSVTNFAWAQYGLNGAPDSLSMPQQPQQQSAVVPYASNSAPYAGQTGGAQGVYSQQVAPYNAPSGYVAQQTQYPATATYAQQPTASQPVVNQSSNPAYRTAYNPRPAYIAQQVQQPALSAPATPQPIPDPMPTLNDPMPQQNQGLTNQMLSAQGQTGVAGCDGYVPYTSPSGSCTSPSGSYRSTVNQYQEAACGADLGCGYNACPWYASISGLAMSRNNANKVWVSNETTNLANQTMNTQDAKTGWKLGGELRFGRRFGCDSCNGCDNNSAGYWAIEADYWTLDPFQGYASFRNADNSAFGTPLIVSYTSYSYPSGAYDTGNHWFGDSIEQRVWRRDEVHSAEVNLIHGQWANVCGSNWDFAFSVGPRFFRFYESLTYGALTHDPATPLPPGSLPQWGEHNGEDEAYVSDQITNNLWGAQVGFDLGYNFAGGALRIFITPKVGIYDNNITSNYQTNLGTGAVGWVNYNHNPNDVPVVTSTTTNSFSVLSQVDVGAEWFFMKNWSARVGYRVVAITGMGLADNQIPFYINDIGATSSINNNCELLLYGGFASLVFNF